MVGTQLLHKTLFEEKISYFFILISLDNPASITVRRTPMDLELHGELELDFFNFLLKERYFNFRMNFNLKRNDSVALH